MDHKAGIAVGADKKDCTEQRGEKHCGLIIQIFYFGHCYGLLCFFIFCLSLVAGASILNDFSLFNSLCAK